MGDADAPAEAPSAGAPPAEEPAAAASAAPASSAPPAAEAGCGAWVCGYVGAALIDLVHRSGLAVEQHHDRIGLVVSC